MVEERQLRLLVERYPELYHMAEAGAWTGIAERGLLSTSWLLDLFEVTGVEREKIESCLRRESVSISHPNFGEAVVRDQKPMHEGKLQDALTDMSPREWYELLNKHVFFWVRKERLVTLLNARAYRNTEHDVLVLETADLLSLVGERARLTPINTGATVYRAAPRGSGTFRPIDAYPLESRIRSHGPDAVVELAVQGGVCNIGAAVKRVERWKGSDVVRRIA